MEQLGFTVYEGRLVRVQLPPFSPFVVIIFPRMWRYQVSELLDVERGFLVKDTVIFSCEVLECCPWPEFNDLDVLASDEDHETLSTDGEDILESDENTDSMANSSISGRPCYSDVFHVKISTGDI